MKNKFFIINSIVLAVLLGSQSSTGFAFARGLIKANNQLAKILGTDSMRRLDSEWLQRLKRQYDVLSESLASSSSSPLTPKLEQQFHSFKDELGNANVLFKDEAMLYIAALANNSNAAALALKKPDFYLLRSFELAIEDGNWDALEFMADFDRFGANHALRDLIVKAANEGNEKVVKKLVEIGGNPTAALAETARRNNKELASRLAELGANLNEALYRIDGHVESGNILLELGADANMALFDFAHKYKFYKVEEELKADNLISTFGADPLLVSELLYKKSQWSKGYEYLYQRYNKYFNIDLGAGRANKINLRKQFIESTEKFAENIEFLTPNEARKQVEEGVSINLALLYLARNNDTVMAKYLIDKLGANPTTIANLAQAAGEEGSALFLRELAK